MDVKNFSFHLFLVFFRFHPPRKSRERDERKWRKKKENFSDTTQTFPVPPEPNIFHCRHEKLLLSFIFFCNSIEINLSHRESHKSTFHLHSESNCETEVKRLLIAFRIHILLFHITIAVICRRLNDWIVCKSDFIYHATGSWVNVSKHAF